MKKVCLRAGFMLGLIFGVVGCASEEWKPTPEKEWRMANLTASDGEVWCEDIGAALKFAVASDEDSTRFAPLGYAYGCGKFTVETPLQVVFHDCKAVDGFPDDPREVCPAMIFQSMGAPRKAYIVVYPERY